MERDVLPAQGDLADTRHSSSPPSLLVTVDISEQAILQLDNNLLGTFIKIRHLCSQETDGIYKAGWNALALAGVSRTALVELQAKGLIAWMWNRNMQFIQVKA